MGELYPIVGRIPAQGHRPEVVYRRQGDRNLLVEYYDSRILSQAKLPQALADASPGARSRSRKRCSAWPTTAETVRFAVVGAHLHGMPLHGQLT